MDVESPAWTTSLTSSDGWPAAGVRRRRTCHPPDLFLSRCGRREYLLRVHADGNTQLDSALAHQYLRGVHFGGGAPRRPGQAPSRGDPLHLGPNCHEAACDLRAYAPTPRFSAWCVGREREDRPWVNQPRWPGLVGRSPESIAIGEGRAPCRLPGTVMRRRGDAVFPARRRSGAA